MFVETDFKQYSVAASLDTASMLNSKACDKPNNVEQLCDRNVSVAVSEIPDARLQCTDNSTSVSHTAPTNVAVDVAAMFRLSPDDFDDDIDDLSFIDLPLHSELAQDSELSAVSSNCHRDVNIAVNTKSSSSVVSDVVCEEKNCFQLLKNNSHTEKHDVNNTLQIVVSTKRKRKFPGPAGVLPKLVRTNVITVSQNISEH